MGEEFCLKRLGLNRNFLGGWGIQQTNRLHFPLVCVAALTEGFLANDWPTVFIPFFGPSAEMDQNLTNDLLQLEQLSYTTSTHPPPWIKRDPHHRCPRRHKWLAVVHSLRLQCKTRKRGRSLISAIYPGPPDLDEESMDLPGGSLSSTPSATAIPDSGTWQALICGDYTCALTPLVAEDIDCSSEMLPRRIWTILSGSRSNNKQLFAQSQFTHRNNVIKMHYLSQERNPPHHFSERMSETINYHSCLLFNCLPLELENRHKSFTDLRTSKFFFFNIEAINPVCWFQHWLINIDSGWQNKDHDGAPHYGPMSVSPPRRHWSFNWKSMEQNPKVNLRLQRVDTGRLEHWNISPNLKQRLWCFRQPVRSCVFWR